MVFCHVPNSSHTHHPQMCAFKINLPKFCTLIVLWIGNFSVNVLKSLDLPVLQQMAIVHALEPRSCLVPDHLLWRVLKLVKES